SAFVFLAACATEAPEPLVVRETDVAPIARRAPSPTPSCLASLPSGSGPFEVELEIGHDEGGFVTDTKVLTSSASCLSEAAVAAVRDWRYPPKLVGDRLAAREGVRVLFIFRNDQ
ncbi:MAG: energy transducer TonB, partial [Parvularcula sp.]|nr:energy transducer TonB [Parvularcula sp.]